MSFQIAERPSAPRRTTLTAALMSLVMLGATGALAQTARAESIFFADCKFSHESHDDPIVLPGEPGDAHSHEFTGAWSTDAYSTPARLLKSGTTCLPAADKSAYWSPTLYQNGKPVRVLGTTAYFNEGDKNEPEQKARLKAYPPSLKMIADMSAYRSGEGGSGWFCGSEARSLGFTLGPRIRACPFTSFQHKVISMMVFPDCWDGKNLDSPDHRSHMSYALPSTDCPASHPVHVPQMSLKTSYDSTGEGGGFSVAHGGGGAHENAPPSTYHADFINGWEQDVLEHLVQYCLKDERGSASARPCGVGEPTKAEDAARSNPSSPDRTAQSPGPLPPSTPKAPPSAPKPTPDPPPSSGQVWSHGPVKLNGIDQQVAIPDVLGSDATYSIRVTYAGPGSTPGDRNVMMIGNSEGDHARVFVNGTDAKAQIFAGGVATALESVPFTADRPHDFVLVRAGKIARFYIDGALVGTSEFGNGDPHDLGPGALGAFRDGEAFYARAPGSYDKARVYAYALTADEAAAP